MIKLISKYDTLIDDKEIAKVVYKQISLDVNIRYYRIGGSDLMSKISAIPRNIKETIND